MAVTQKFVRATLGNRAQVNRQKWRPSPSLRPAIGNLARIRSKIVQKRLRLQILLDWRTFLVDAFQNDAFQVTDTSVRLFRTFVAGSVTTQKALFVALTLSVFLLRNVSKLLSVAQGLRVVLDIIVSKLLAVAQGLRVNLDVTVSKTLAVAQGIAVSLIKAVAKTLSAFIPISVNLFKQALTTTQKLLQASVAVAVSLTRSTGKLLQVAQGLAVSLDLFVAKTLRVAQGIAVALAPVKSLNRTLSVAQGISVAVFRQTLTTTQKLLQASVAVAVRLTNNITKPLSVAQAIVVSLDLNVGKLLRLTLNPAVAVTLLRTTLKLLTVPLGQLVRLVTVFVPGSAVQQKFLRVTQGVSVRLIKAVTTTLSVVLVPVINLFKQANVRLRTFLPVSVSLFRGRAFGKLLSAFLLLRVNLTRSRVFGRFLRAALGNLVRLFRAPVVIEIPSWPSTIPIVPTTELEAGYQFTVLNDVLRSELDQGPARLRRRFTRMLHRVEFDILMTVEQFALFKGFYQSTLRQGTAEFLMLIYDGSSYANHTCKFVQPYSTADYAIDMTRVRFQLHALDFP